MARKKYIKENMDPIESSDYSVENTEIDMNGNGSRRDGVTNKAGEKDGRDTVALILSIIFVAALGFFGYQYFNNADLNLTNRFSNVINMVGNDEEGEISSDSTVRDTSDDTRSNNETASDEARESEDNTPDGAVGGSSDRFVRNVYAEGQMWVANDYQQGDIETGNYTVVQGDTLWELAEGAYGDGAQWTRILEANSDAVGHLANGQQALIMTGQVLVIPAS